MLTKKPGSKRRYAGAAITGARLREERVKAGVTQQRLADVSGYSSVYISDLECGRSRIGPRTARALLLAIEDEPGAAR